MKSKNHRYSTLRRPTQLLYSVGLKSEDESVASDDYGNPAMSHAGEGFQQQFEPRRNPRRAAAVESQRRRRAWIEKLVWFAWLVELQTSPKSCFPSYLIFACRDLCWPITQRFSVFLYWSKSARMLGIILFVNALGVIGLPEMCSLSVAHTVRKSSKPCWAYDRIGASSFLMAT